MKKNLIIYVTAVTAFLAGAVGASARNVAKSLPVNVGGVGVVVAGSVDETSLPDKAKKFVSKLHERVMSCEREFATGRYEVKLDTGIELEFAADGSIVEVDAPDRAVLGDDLVKRVVPHKVYDKLKDMGLVRKVKSIEKNRMGYYEIDVASQEIDEILFNAHGEIMAVYYE